MSLGLFQLQINPSRRDQLFFSATGLPMGTPSLRFLLSRICWKVGAVSRARAFCAAKRTLDIAPSFHRMLLESEGKKTLKAGAFGVTSPFAPPSPSVARRGRAKRTRKLTLAADRPPALFTLRRIKHARWRRHAPSETVPPYPQILLQSRKIQSAQTACNCAEGSLATIARADRQQNSANWVCA